LRGCRFDQVQSYCYSYWQWLVVPPLKAPALLLKSTSISQPFRHKTKAVNTAATPEVIGGVRSRHQVLLDRVVSVQVRGTGLYADEAGTARRDLLRTVGFDGVREVAGLTTLSGLTKVLGLADCGPRARRFGRVSDVNGAQRGPLAASHRPHGAQSKTGRTPKPTTSSSFFPAIFGCVAWRIRTVFGFSVSSAWGSF
jgi:hypothetical protein